MTCLSFFQLKSTFSSDNKDIELEESKSADIDQLENDSIFQDSSSVHLFQ